MGGCDSPPIINLGERMRAHYDRDVDALAISWGDAVIKESDEVEPGVILDYDAEGNVVGVEILDASTKVNNL